MSAPPIPPIAGQIVVAGSVGKASIGAMIAALLHAAGQHAVQLNGRFLHSPLERLRIDGQSLDAAAARELLSELPERPTGDAAIEALLHLCLAHLDAPWLVVSGAPPLPVPVSEIVFAPILPQGA